MVIDMVIKGVLFDFDGTLTHPGALDFPAIKLELGCPVDQQVLEYLDTQPSGRRAKLMKILEKKEDIAAQASQPNRGAEKCLINLKNRGLALGILTRNSLSSVKKALQKFNGVTAEDFSAIITRDGSQPKPHPDGVLQAARRMGLASSELLVVGDFRFDVMAGKAAGAWTALLTDGERPVMSPEDPEPDFTISHLETIFDILTDVLQGRPPSRAQALWAGGRADPKSKINMNQKKNKSLVLAGDIGGTKTNLGLFLMGKRRPLLKATETYSSRNAPDLESIVERFLEKHQAPIAGACFGIAGPVVNGQCKTTNLSWNVSEVQIKRRFRWKHVRLINDLTAMAMAIPLLKSDEFFSLNRVRARKEKNIGLIAPGTGLGEALLIFQNGRYIPVSSEGGHVDFAPNSRTEVRLWEHLHRRFGHVSIERLLSGPGLINIYSWLKDTGHYREPAWLKRKIKEKDTARAITETAMDQKQALCVRSLDMFITILGSVSGNLALTALTNGGLYLGGGILPQILPKLKEGPFMKAFVNKGRFKNLLENIPVRVILNDRAALSGAAYSALKTP
jgi:glucokinase